MIYELCIDIEHPVLALAECARRGIPGPAYARELIPHEHSHVFTEDPDEDILRDWLAEDRYLLGVTREDGSCI